MRWLLLAPFLIWLHINLVFAWVAHANPFAGSPSAIERLVTRANPFDERLASQEAFEREVARLVGQREVYCAWRGRTLPATEWDCAPGDRDEEMNAGLNCPLYRVDLEGDDVHVEPIGSGRLRPDRVAIAEKWQRAWRRRENRRLRKSRPGGIPVSIGPKVRSLAAPWQVSGLCRRLTGA